MDKSFLNIDVPQERLDEMYSGIGPDGDYYWYLKSKPFIDRFLRPIGQLINKYCDSVLDVGCGEGWLSDFTECKYYGIEGSSAAIFTANHVRSSPRKVFIQTKIESPVIDLKQVDCIVFGGILDVLIKKDRQLPFVQWYINRFNPNYFIIYDLDRLDESQFINKFNCIHGFNGTVDMTNLQEVKRTRKVSMYEV